jgi:hypothetical protein
MHKYLYKGPVMAFDKVLAHCWEATTYAVSESKAKCNFMYQFKKECNKLPNAKITLLGKIVKLE